jgi:hypothetical protein
VLLAQVASQQHRRLRIAALAIHAQYGGRWRGQLTQLVHVALGDRAAQSEAAGVHAADIGRGRQRADACHDAHQDKTLHLHPLQKNDHREGDRSSIRHATGDAYTTAPSVSSFP